jgi:hypothetical protein
MTVKFGRNHTRFYAPDTHGEYFVPIDRDWATLEDICEFKKATAIGGCAFWKYDDRSIGGASNLLKARTIAIRRVQRSTSGTHDDV